MEIITTSAEKTFAWGQQLASGLLPGAIVCLYGDLGAGKTTLIKGIVCALTDTSPEEVCSPTFTYLQVYEGKYPVYHFDLYRLQDAEDFVALGFEEYLFSSGVCCIEWSERIAAILPNHAMHITLNHCEEDRRKIIYENSKS